MPRCLSGSSIAIPGFRIPGCSITRKLPALLPLLLALLASVAPALGQSSFSFSYTLADGNAHALTAGSTITFPSVDIHAATAATVTITNNGLGSGTVSGLTVSGTGFQLSNPTVMPATVQAGQSLVFQIIFAPPQPGSFTGTFQINLSGTAVSGSLAGSTPPPNLSLNYIDPSTGNTLPLANNSTLPFPNTQVGASSTVTVLVSNTGTGTGSVSSIALSGAAAQFQLVSLVPLPVLVGPSQQLQFGIRFTPTQQQASTAVLTANLNGQTTTVNLQAQGIQPIYSYLFSSSAGATTVLAGGTVAIPNTTVGQITNVMVTVTNTGMGAGQVALITTTGQGLSVTDSPILPVTVQPNGSVKFTLSFAPTQPGAISGLLYFGTDTVTITATAVGSQLTYTYTSGSSAIPVAANGAVIFTPLQVGSTESLNFSLQNSGTSPATISSINLGAPSTVFTLSGLPAMPATLNPGAAITFPISFAPNNTGNLTATLLVNGNSFTLTGNGAQPPVLPAYTFTVPSGTGQPAQQPGVGLTLASPYPLPLQGTLTLTFNSNVFSDDTAIEFANGARTVNFTIPANATQAVFSGNATTVPLQTGTTSGTIVITPSLSLLNGFSMTPASPNTLTLSIPKLAPALLSGSVSAATTTSFTVTLSGYTTTRVLNSLSIQFTPVSGHTFNPSQLTIDVSSASSAWFQGAAASGFGGSFLLAIPFTLSSGSSTANLVDLLQSVSITATNDVGTSSSIMVPIP